MTFRISALASPGYPKAPPWLGWLAGVVPLAFYLATASSFGGFHEEGALTAAARSLGVSHAPGAPLSSLIASFFALLPVGPLSFRVSVSAAVCAALMLGLFARAMFYTLLGVGVRAPQRAAPLALCCAWFVAQSPLFWQQAVRPNAYALQFALSMIVLECLLRFELKEPTNDTRVLYFAAFVQGLCFANHHVFGLLMLAPAAPTLGRVFARRGFIGLMGHVAFPILGFSAYAYVPIRASQHPFINFGEASNLRNLYWMINADPYWGPAYIEPPSLYRALMSGLFRDQVWLALIIVGLAGVTLAYSLRSSALRRFSLLWTIALLVPLASVGLLIRPRVLADAWGALVPCALSLVALACCGLGLLLEAELQVELRPRWERFTRASSWALAAGVGLSLLDVGGGVASSLAAADALDELTRRSLPARAVVLTHDAATYFRHVGAEAEEHMRPDVTLVPLSFASVPGAFSALRQQAPELDQLLSAERPLDKHASKELAALSRKRPVFVELHEQVPRSLHASLREGAWFYRVSPGHGAEAGETGDARSSPWAERALTLSALPPEVVERRARRERLRDRLANAAPNAAGARERGRMAP